jgi:3-oxoadipate enol-lactonase
MRQIEIIGVKRIYKTLVAAFLFIISFPLVAYERSAIPLQTDSGYADVNGVKLYYEMAGSGVPLVLIHGSFGDRRFWDLQFVELSKKYKVVRYDVRGYGKSSLPREEDVYNDAEDLNALMGFLGIDKAHLCGLSLGSIIIVDFALAFPDKCISLILAGPRVAGDATDEYKSSNSDTVRTILAKTSELAKNKGAKEATDYLWTGDHVMRKGIVSPVTRAALLKMGYEYSWRRYTHPNKRTQVFPMAIKKLSEIKIPTLIITADLDFALCQEVAARMAQDIPGAKLTSLRNAGHIMNMDKPVEFNRAVNEFIIRLR